MGSHPYAGAQAQSFDAVQQDDGFWGTRTKYNGRVLTKRNDGTVSGAACNGTRPRRISLHKQSDGSWGRSFYASSVLTDSPIAQ
ncbi:hypothetical protein ACWCZ5_03605 [Streptomyces sp. NPDC001667]